MKPPADSDLIKFIASLSVGGEDKPAPLDDLRKSYDTFLENCLLPSSYPDKHPAQIQVEGLLEQLEFHTFFPHLLGRQLYCLVGFSPRDREAFFKRLGPYLPPALFQNKSIPAFYAADAPPAFLVSAHGGQRQLGETPLPALLEGLRNHDIERRRLLAAVSLPCPAIPAGTAVIDLPEGALPDSRFFQTIISISGTLALAKETHDNRPLLEACAKASDLRPGKAVILRHSDTRPIPLPQAAPAPFTLDWPRALHSALLKLPVWLTREEAKISASIASLTGDLVRLDTAQNDLRVKFQSLRADLEARRKQNARDREKALKAIEAIRGQAGKLIQGLQPGNRPAAKAAEARPEPVFSPHSFSDQEEYFLQLLAMEDRQAASDLGQEMEDGGYPYSFALEMHLAESASAAPPNKAVAALDKFLNSLSENRRHSSFPLRALIHFRKHIRLADENAGAIAERITRESADEHYVYGKYLLLRGQKEAGEKCLRKSLALGGQEAGRLLLELDHDESSLNFLARHQVAEANYRLGIRLCDSENPSGRDRGWVNLKIAAALGNMPAMEEIAGHEYKIGLRKYQNEFWSPSEKERAAKAAQTAKMLYLHLLEKGELSVKSRVNYGELLYREKDYREALNILSGCDDSFAYMRCGDMYEFGDGVTEDLQEAKRYYEKAIQSGENDFESKIKAYRRLGRIDGKLQKQREKKSAVKIVYAPTVKQQPTRTTTSDSWCFITTATCLSLGKGDGCRELSAFRDLRDNYLAGRPGGRALIEEYYALAPGLIRNIERRPDRAVIYRQIWKNHLKPAYSCLLKDDPAQAVLIYTRLTGLLRRLFGSGKMLET